jgi:enoyl-CoA hydratase/carnithine racemase
MPEYETIILDRDPQEHIARITLNRPDRLNAINQQMGAELVEAIESLAQDDEVHVVVLTGAGRAFCSGADTGGMVGGQVQGQHAADRGAEEIRRGFRTSQRMILGLHRMEKPTIAMVNGAAVGAGLDLACACDIRLGSPSARFMSAYVRIGLFPGYGGAWLYPRVLGSVAKAAELLFTGDFIEAEEALQHGLLNRLVDVEELDGATMDMARKIAQGPPIAIRLAKLMLYKGLEFDLETSLQMAAAAETITLTSQDHREGVDAFREKRKARFTGQ